MHCQCTVIVNCHIFNYNHFNVFYRILEIQSIDMVC